MGTIEFTITSTELKSLGLPKREWTSKAGKCHNYYTIRYRPVIKMCGRNIRYGLWFEGTERVTCILQADNGPPMKKAQLDSSSRGPLSSDSVQSRPYRSSPSRDSKLSLLRPSQISPTRDSNLSPSRLKSPDHGLAELYKAQLAV